MDKENLIKAREQKHQADVKRRLRHLELFEFVDINNKGDLARSLASQVINDWKKSNCCGSYYIHLWSDFLLRSDDGFIASFSMIDEDVALAMCTNSPFFHGFGNRKVMEVIYD